MKNKKGIIKIGKVTKKIEKLMKFNRQSWNNYSWTN